MYKKGSMMTLLVVALAALGLMTFVSFANEVTGNFSSPGQGVPVGKSSYGVEKPQTIDSDVARVQLQCYIWKYDHPNVQAPVEIEGLCARFGVAV